MDELPDNLKAEIEALDSFDARALRRRSIRFEPRIERPSLTSALGHALRTLTKNRLAPSPRWQDLGLIIAGGNLRIGDIKGKPEIEKARGLGASIA
jgi:hypothetical protein